MELDRCRRSLSSDTLNDALDAHTVENRTKRKELQAQRTGIARSLEALGRNAAEGQKAMGHLYASVESALALATHTEQWSWKQVVSVNAES